MDDQAKPPHWGIELLLYSAPFVLPVIGFLATSWGVATWLSAPLNSENYFFAFIVSLPVLMLPSFLVGLAVAVIAFVKPAWHPFLLLAYLAGAFLATMLGWMLGQMLNF